MIINYANGSIRVNLWWRGEAFNVYVYTCKNTSQNLDTEIRLRGITPDKPATVIPANLVHSSLELLQGALHYKLYSHRMLRVKNRGLALAMLILGERQLDRLIELLEMNIKSSLNYYVVSIDVDIDNKVECTPLIAEPGSLGRDELLKLVKNVDTLLSIT